MTGSDWLLFLTLDSGKCLSSETFGQVAGDGCGVGKAKGTVNAREWFGTKELQEPVTPPPLPLEETGVCVRDRGIEREGRTMNRESDETGVRDYFFPTMKCS